MGALPAGIRRVQTLHFDGSSVFVFTSSGIIMAFGRLLRHTSALLLGAVVLTSCGSDTVSAPQEIPLDQQTWASSLGVTLSAFTKLPSGIYYLDTVVGTGAAVSGTPSVSVYYAGYLASGSKFDERARSSNTPLVFPLTQVIQGWQVGMQGMKVGGKRRLLIPAALGYGASGNGPIPGNANLLFDIELVGLN